MNRRQLADDAVAVQYRIDPVDPHAHLFEVTLTVSRPDPDGQQLSLPAWIPGSYMVRDFARNIVAIDAHSGNKPAALTKTDKQTWRVAPTRGALTVRYRVYAWDLSVRGAHLDATHGFFNATSVFLRVHGLDSAPCEIEIVRPQGPAFAQWRVATTLAAAGARRWEFGRYRADDYDELLDHPVEIGAFETVGFEAGGARHDIAVTGRHDGDLSRFAADLKPVCEAQIAMFEPRRRLAPVKRYLFLLTVLGDGYGGLEHRSSTALVCPRRNLPHDGTTAVDDAYQELLGLASHEYFHMWNVKRIKPAAFVPYHLDREVYTELLWVFEGFTSYYDDLMLLRGGAIDRSRYLSTVARRISSVLRGPGRFAQSVAESSFDAWTKFYRQDENAPNAIVSYYAKGAIVALALDIEIRLRTGGKRSLDDVMRAMWGEFGENFAAHARGVPERAMPGIVRDATGVDLSRQIRAWVYGTGELPLARLLRGVGIRMKQAAPENGAPWLGLRHAIQASELRVTHCLAGGPAQLAGLAAGDTLVAIDGIRVATDESVRATLTRHAAGDVLRIHAFRRDELHEFTVRLGEPPATEVTLEVDAAADASRLRMREQWLKRGSKRTPRMADR